MIRAVANYFATIPPVFIDGSLYVVIAFNAALTASFGSDDAAKYISPLALWWMRQCCTWIGAGLLALKMYRSTQFAEHQEQKKNGTNPPFKP